MSVNTRNGKNKPNTLVAAVQSPSLSIRSENDCKLNELSTMLLEKLSEMESRLMERISSISAEVSNIRADLKASFMRLDAVESKLSVVVGDIESINKRLRNFENAVIASDCIVYNVPNTADADVVVKRALIALECNHIEPLKVFRISSNNNKKSSTNKCLPIIIKLKSADERIKLFKALAAYRKKNLKNLLLSDVGLGGNVNLSIFESLTMENRAILNAALQLKRNNVIRAAYSMRGSVFIRVHDNDKAVVIHDLVTLQTLTGSTMS